MSTRGDAQTGTTEQTRGTATHLEPETTTRMQDSRQLAWLAEHAHGLGGKPLVLIKAADGRVVLKERGRTDETDVVLFDVETSLVQPDRLKLEQVMVRPEGKEPFDLRGECDALFWTESSIEKFLLPYYHAQRLLTADGMAALMEAYRSKEVVAIAHVPPSHHLSIKGADPLAAINVVVTMVGKAADSGEVEQLTLREFLSRKRH